MGRPATYRQCTPFDCPTFTELYIGSCTYDLAGDMTGWRNPEGFTLTNTFNTAQQITQVAAAVVAAAAGPAAARSSNRRKLVLVERGCSKGMQVQLVWDEGGEPLITGPIPFL